MQLWWDFGKAHFVSSKLMLPCNTVLVKHEELVESTGYISKSLKRACLSSSQSTIKNAAFGEKVWT